MASGPGQQNNGLYSNASQLTPQSSSQGRSPPGTWTARTGSSGHLNRSGDHISMKLDRSKADFSFAAPKLLADNTLVLPYDGTDVTVTTPFITLPSGVTCQPGDLVQRKQLGFGNFGHVFLAVHRENGETIAIKQLVVNTSFKDQEKKKQLIRELDVLKTSSSPYIVNYSGAFFKEGELNICMEYMDGGSLADLLNKGGPVPEPVLGKITLSVVLGLDYLKERHQIIHRDVKPSNILANTQGAIKLCDFGISGKLERSVAKTRGAFCGNYLCPERVMNKLSAYGVESDVWSLGISVIELAMGAHPFGSNMTMMEIMGMMIGSESPTLPDTCSPEIRDFVAMCLQKDPTVRPRKYAILLQHPFLQRSQSELVDVGAWVRSIIEPQL